MGLFDIEPKKKKEEPTKETPEAPQGAKALQFMTQGETKRMMASGDSTEGRTPFRRRDSAVVGPMTAVLARARWRFIAGS